MQTLVKASRWESRFVRVDGSRTIHALHVHQRGGPSTARPATHTATAPLPPAMTVPAGVAPPALPPALAPPLPQADSGRGVRRRRTVPASCSSGAAQSPTAAVRKPVMVLCHGFGTGAAIFAHNFDDLAREYDVHSLDMSGSGLSARRQGAFRDHQHAEETLVQDLETFLDRSGLDRVTLVGHSFGGYVCGAYALKHPERIERLVLVSPVGLPDHRNDAAAGTIRGRTVPVWARPVVGSIKKLWQWGTTPQSVVRLAGRAGPRLVRRYVTRRFTDDVNKEVLVDYMVSAAPAACCPA